MTRLKLQQPTWPEAQMWSVPKLDDQPNGPRMFTIEIVVPRACGQLTNSVHHVAVQSPKSSNVIPNVDPRKVPVLTRRDL